MPFGAGGFLEVDGVSAIRTDYPNVVHEVITNVNVASHPAVDGGFLTVRALWDTGATFSVISREKAAALGLAPVDFSCAYTANGWYETPVYRIDVLLPNGIMVKGLRVSQSDLMVCDMLLGMDVISLGDLHLTNDGNTVFSFHIPPEKRSSP